MAIAEMTKLNLVGMAYEKQLLLNSLTDTGAVQIKCGEDEFVAAGEDATVTDIAEKLDRLNRVVEFVEEAARNADKSFKSNSELVDVAFNDFLNVDKKAQEIEDIIVEVEKTQAQLLSLKAQKSKLSMQLSQVSQYASVDVPFNIIKDTKKVKFFLGTLSTDAANRMATFVKEESKLSEQKICGEGDSGTVVFVVCHAEEREKISSKLNELNFTKCPFDMPITAKQRQEELSKEISLIDNNQVELNASVLKFVDNLGLLRLYIDRLQFEKQKLTYCVGFDKTAATFNMQAYLPVDAKDAVSQKITEASDAVYFAFDDIDQNEEAPTLMRNNKIIRQFEGVTNMYSAPAYREFDPNTFVGIFFAVFFGFIMADMGYGVLLTVFGLLFASRMKRDTGMRRLMYVIGIGGIFTIIFGYLFGGFFGLTRADGIQWLPVPIIPDPVKNSQEVLLYSLLGGAIHLMFGYISKGLSCIRQKKVWDGIWDGFVWALFFVGMILLFPMMGETLLSVKIFGMTTVPPMLTKIGLGICLVVVAVQIFASGRHAKGFGKFTSGFGAVYGLINFFSDLLSYARLYGLMLSGAMIANIVSTMSIGLMKNGIVGIVGAVLILIIGHAFNLAMGVLGAYIHDARLQFIEYFGKFYEGNGELFKPLGSNLTYTELTLPPQNNKPPRQPKKQKSAKSLS